MVADLTQCNLVSTVNHVVMLPKVHCFFHIVSLMPVTIVQQAGLPTHTAPSSCDSTLADHCVHFTINYIQYISAQSESDGGEQLSLLHRTTAKENILKTKKKSH